MNAHREVMTVGRQGIIERYRDWFPEDNITITLGEGSTPLLPATRLAKHLGLRDSINLWLKLEAANPTGSFKDRGMAVAVSRAVRDGVKTVVCASTGNTAASAAAFAARAGILGVVLVPAGAVAPGKLAQVAAFGALVLEIEGNFDDALSGAIDLCRRRSDLRLVNSVNPDRIDGQRTAAFEICDELNGSPEAVILPVGNAGNITAYWRGFSDYFNRGIIRHRPKMFGVQAEGAASLVLGRDIETPQTAATAIRIGRPASRAGAEQAARESGGTFWAVTDDHLRQARDLLGSLEGVYVELASSAPIAALLADPARLEANGINTGNVVCILTGSGIKEPDLAPRPKLIRCSADTAAIEKAIDGAVTR